MTAGPYAERAHSVQNLTGQKAIHQLILGIPWSPTHWTDLGQERADAYGMAHGRKET